MHTLQHSCLVLSSNQLKHIVLSIYLSYWPKAQKLLFLLTQRSPFHFLPSLLPLRESWCLIRALGSLEYIWWRIRTYGRRCNPQIRDLRWDDWPSLVPFFWDVPTHGYLPMVKHVVRFYHAPEHTKMMGLPCVEVAGFLQLCERRLMSISRYKIPSTLKE